VLNLVLAVVQNSRPGISKYMHEARHAKANDASLANNPAWLLLTEKAISLADEE
jgi:hypothetical protein